MHYASRLPAISPPNLCLVSRLYGLFYRYLYISATSPLVCLLFEAFLRVLTCVYFFTRTSTCEPSACHTRDAGYLSLISTVRMYVSSLDILRGLSTTFTRIHSIFSDIVLLDCNHSRPITIEFLVFTCYSAKFLLTYTVQLNTIKLKTDYNRRLMHSYSFECIY